MISLVCYFFFQLCPYIYKDERICDLISDHIYIKFSAVMVNSVNSYRFCLNVILDMVLSFN